MPDAKRMTASRRSSKPRTKQSATAGGSNPKELSLEARLSKYRQAKRVPRQVKPLEIDLGFQITLLGRLVDLAETIPTSDNPDFPYYRNQILGSINRAAREIAKAQTYLDFFKYPNRIPKRTND
jgi:hypothetical protein